LIEWPEGEAEPTKYGLSTLPENISFTDIVEHGRHVQKGPIALVKVFVKVYCHGQRLSVRWIATRRRSRSIRKAPEADALARKIDSLFQTTNVDESVPFLCPRRK
jgi:hypothetical protein